VHKYFLILKISIQDQLEYRFDLYTQTAKYAFGIVLMALVWLAVARENLELTISPQEIINYYLIAAILFSLSNLHTWNIEDDIRLGMLSKYLLKPITPFWHYFAFEAGSTLIQTVLRLLVLAPIVWYFQSDLTASPWHLVLFLAYLPTIYYFSFHFFFTLSSLAFWLQEVFALRWAWMGILRLISGIFVPLHFFPDTFRAISSWFPFQYLVYFPIQVAQQNVTLNQAQQGLLILISWTVIMAIASRTVWRLGLLRYESTGA
jgi:ABC-2 type transport system permease protein